MNKPRSDAGDRFKRMVNQIGSDHKKIVGAVKYCQPGGPICSKSPCALLIFQAKMLHAFDNPVVNAACKAEEIATKYITLEVIGRGINEDDPTEERRYIVKLDHAGQRSGPHAPTQVFT